MHEWQRIALNGVTVAAWILGICIMCIIVAKRKKMQQEAGVSVKTYLSLVVAVEILYIVGVIMILTAMGLHVMQHLARLEFRSVYGILQDFDMSTVRFVGVMGWIGFGLNLSVSFLTPLYLLIKGGRKLHRHLRFLAWTEIGLESFIAILIFASLKFG